MLFRKWRSPALFALLAAAKEQRSGNDTVREPGRCAMYGSCGKKGGMFGQDIPCVDNSPAVPVNDDNFKSRLQAVCGVAWDTVCCSPDSIDVLAASLQQAESFIALCPACSKSFRNYYCQFTCSPNQSQFVTITDTEIIDKDKGQAVKELEIHVDHEFAQVFFDACKNVKFSATNGYAMQFLGGGASTWHAFLSYMGQKRPGLGSPFQIDIPLNSSYSDLAPLKPPIMSCSDPSPEIGCACADCPSRCLELPYLPSPSEIRASQCHVGQLDCYSFFFIVVYAIILVTFTLSYARRSSILQKHGIHIPYTAQPDSDDEGFTLPTAPPSSSTVRSNTYNSMSSSWSRKRLGKGASVDVTAAHLSAYQPRTYPVNNILSKLFYNIGLLCARSPFLVIAVALAVVGILNSGWSRFSIETDPVKLWTDKNSVALEAKELFDKEFGPFYRTQQIFVASRMDEPVFSWERIQWWQQKEEEMRALETTDGIKLSDVCFAPTADPSQPASDTSLCVIQSFVGYSEADPWNEDNWTASLEYCATNPTACLPTSGAPLNPRLLFGHIPGYSGNATFEDGETVHASRAKAFVITFVVNNARENEVDALHKAKAWEKVLQNYIKELQKEAANNGLELTFSTEISLEEELSKSTNTDITTVIISYIGMFVYVALALGSTSPLGIISAIYRKFTKRRQAIALPSANDPPSLGSFFVQSRATLGLVGISIVLLSIATSISIFSLFKIKATLIIAEVIPFLVLAIGVDNIFILCHEVDVHSRRPDGLGTADDSGSDDGLQDLEIPIRVASALARMGPSIFASAMTQTVCFSLGALVGMPAVRNFAIYAAGAVFINVLLQLTLFVAAIVLDLRRRETGRADCVPCVVATRRSIRSNAPVESKLDRFVRIYYAPNLLRSQVKACVVATFVALALLSFAFVQRVQLGLDQRLALPSESYLIPYFNSVDNYLDIGPPVYFIESDIDVRHRTAQQALCGRFSTCLSHSASNILEAERKRTATSFLAEPPAVWLDDFFQWLNPTLETCCRVKKRDTSQFCTPNDSEFLCKPCFEGHQPPWSITMEGLPENEEFMRYLHQWIESPADQDCSLGGRAAYATSLSFTNSSTTSTKVSASHLRTYHTPLRSQNDFIDAMLSARRISEEISEATGSKVHAYSLFYPFFDQYATIVATARSTLFIALVAVFAIMSVFLGSVRSAGVVTLSVAMILLNVWGVMGMWNISLNGISLVNLVISIGISVEFCSHVARAFSGAAAPNVGIGAGGLPHDHPLGAQERDGRAEVALCDVGTSVFSGITLTKVIGICVLAFTRSKLLRVYYFRMWLTLIISGALHGLVFLPVALSYMGGRGYVLDPESEFDQAEIWRQYEGENEIFLRDDDARSLDSNLS